MSYSFDHSAMMTDGVIEIKLAHHMNKLAHNMNKQEYVFVCWVFSAFRPFLSCMSSKGVDTDS